MVLEWALGLEGEVQSSDSDQQQTECQISVIDTIARVTLGDSPAPAAARRELAAIRRELADATAALQREKEAGMGEHEVVLEWALDLSGKGLSSGACRAQTCLLWQQATALN